MRLYLDHRQTHLTRRYGPSSPELAAFNESRRAEHVESPEYAFVYELRNFVQHCGMPLQVIRVGQRLVAEGNTERIETETIVSCDRDQLLGLFADWRHSKSFIRSQDETFSIAPMLSAMLRSLERIEIATVKAIMPALWDDARFVTSILQEGCDVDATGMVGSPLPSKPIPEQFALSLKLPPFSILGWLKLVSLTDESPGYRPNTIALAWETPPQVELG